MRLLILATRPSIRRITAINLRRICQMVAFPPDLQLIRKEAAFAFGEMRLNSGVILVYTYDSKHSWRGGYAPDCISGRQSGFFRARPLTTDPSVALVAQRSQGGIDRKGSSQTAYRAREVGRDR